jgi:hypothetical protein
MLKQNQHKSIILWLLSGCFIIYLMIVIGCITRLTHSGLSITEWGVMGTMPPFGEDKWQEVFSKYQESPEFKEVNYDMTIQQFIITHKIERIKDLLLYGEMNLSEISYKMHYSSIAHLSNQFKKITGITPSSYKNREVSQRIPLEEIGKVYSV